MKTSDLTMRRPEQTVSTIASKLYYKQEGAERRLDISTLVTVCCLKVS